MLSISQNFGIATLSRLILGGISLVIVGILTRTLGPTGYGHYSLIFAYLFVVTALADLGLYTVLVREISLSGAAEKNITSNIFTLRLVAVVLFSLFGVLVSLFLPYPSQVRLGILVASLFAVFSSLVQVLTGIFQKYLKLYYVSLADVVARGLQLILVMTAVRLKAELVIFIWIVAISELVHFLLVYGFSRKLIRVGLKLDFDYWAKILRTALPIALSLVFTLLYFKLDTVLLSLMKPASDVGIYSVAYKILEVVIFLPAIYVGLVMPVLSRHAFENRPEFIRTFRRSFDTLAIFAIPTMAYLFFQAEDIIRIISGSGFPQSVLVLQILSGAVMLIFFGNLGGNALVALDLQKKGMWIYFSGAAFNIATNLALIPKYTYLATAWTTMLTELLITLAMFWLIKKETQVSPLPGVFLKAVGAAAITAAVVHPLNLDLALATSLSLIYIPILFLMGGFTVENLRAAFYSKIRDPIG